MDPPFGGSQFELAFGHFWTGPLLQPPAAYLGQSGKEAVGTAGAWDITCKLGQRAAYCQSPGDGAEPGIPGG